jgi:hypothetical protein
MYAQQYKDPSVVEGRVDTEKREALVREQLHRLRSVRENAGNMHLDISLAAMLETRSRFAAKKTAPGHDSIGWDFLANLPVHVVESLRKAFVEQLNCMHEYRGTKFLKRILVRLIPKPGVDSTRLTNWRPISLTTTIEKLYMACVCELLDQHADPLSSGCLGFRRGHQTMEASGCVRIALQKHGSWKQPFFCITADVHKAFDSLNHDVIRHCLETDHTPPQIVHAVLSSLVSCGATFNLQGVPSSCEVLLNSGGKKGASETPSIWVRVLDTAWKAAVTHNGNTKA